MPSKPVPPLVIAHRGASAYRPENTRPAYALALEQRADMIEVDLHLSRDGAIVIAHDAQLGRLGAEGVIGDRSLAELRALDASAGKAEATQIPTLDEVLDEFGAKIPFNLEFKRGSDGPYPGLPAATLEAVERRGLLDRTLFSCFDDAILEELRGLSPRARLAVLVDPRQPEPRNILARARRVRAEAVNPHFLLASEELIREAHAEGCAVYAYTVDEIEVMETLLAREIDGLFTNRPDRMRGVVEGSAADSR
ncbi:MAG: glycerophosphodiester phosphodiesterase [Myxococcota bacterium]|nr:glycerophosphodiester phosphodiesterase [Myxococcota bacterium]